MADSDDLDDMTSKELIELRNRIDLRIAERQEADRADLLAAMRRRADEVGVSLDDLFGGSGHRNGPRGVVAAKYRNPDNPTETWSGRGRMPNWLATKIAVGGAAKEDFAI